MKRKVTKAKRVGIVVRPASVSIIVRPAGLGAASQTQTLRLSCAKDKRTGKIKTCKVVR